MSEEAQTDEEKVDMVGLIAANRARRSYLAEHGVPPPVELQYSNSLLEYLILNMGGQEILSEAQAYHEMRVAPILDRAVAQVTANEEKQRSMQAQRTLMGH